MRIISVDSVRGGELLAKDIVNSNNSILMTAGTVIKKEYVERLRDLEIDFLFVEDEIGEGIDISDSLEIHIKEQCQDAVRNILLKYSYHNDTELEDIKYVADEIIYDVLSQPEVIYNLSGIRNKNESTYSHSINVCVLSVILSIKLKIPKKKIRDIAIGCLLHDIGIIYMPTEYLEQNIDECSPRIKREIMKHTVNGYSIVENMEWLSSVSKDIILNHHERLDGSGYPFKLRGEKIKIGSRIAAVCDVFDSLVYGNMVRKMKVHDAIDLIVSHANIKYDFNVVNTFMASVAAYPIGALVITNEDEIGIVLRQNPKCPTRPVIRIIKNRAGKKPDGWLEKDLTRELTLFITDTIVD